MLPMFMFSATFYPIAVYPDAIEWIVKVPASVPRVSSSSARSPRERSELIQLLNVAYLGLMGLIGMAIAGRRIDGLLLK